MNGAAAKSLCSPDLLQDWLRSIPERWRLVPLKALVDLRSGSTIDANDIEASGDFPVYGGNGLRGFTTAYTHDGHYILIGRQGALCGNINYADGKFWASEHALVGHPVRETVPRWLGNTLTVLNLGQYSTAAAQPGLSAEKLGNVRVPLPSENEQRAIATYLDRETARIDGLIEKKARFIALLKEKRVAVIAHAVTKGLNRDAPMKDSGQPWLGEVPAHWEVTAAARLFTERDERSQSGDEELLTVSHLTGVTPKSEKTVHMIEAESHEGYKICEQGDLAVNTLWAWMGAMGTSPMRGMISPSYHVYTPGSALNPVYVDAIVRLPVFAREVKRFSKGVWSSRLRLYPEGFREVCWPVPPKQEQEEITRFLAAQTARIDTLISKTEQSIALLKEKRAALITAAVTGKIDVRSAA